MGQFDKLNQLEKRASSAEESASEVRWQQAEEVARLVGAGLQLKDIAAAWINFRTGRPYDVGTVGRYAKLADLPIGKRRTWSEAWYSINPSASYEGVTQRMPSNEEGVAMVLEKAAKVLQDKYEWTEAEVKQEIAAAKVKPEVEPAAVVKKTKVDHNYDILDHVAEELDDLEPPFSRRAQAKYDQVFLKFQVVGEEMTV